MNPISRALLILRLTVAAFFLVWAIEKFVSPETTQAIFDSFYGVSGLPVWGAYLIGVIQLALIGAFVGWERFRFVSVGVLLVMHAGSTLSTWQQLIHPYDGGNHLFWAAVPTLGALIALFILRDEDDAFLIGT